MTKLEWIEGRAAPLPIENLDTDQIMPKQFLRITDKAGLRDGLMYDLRFDEHGHVRTDFVLNQPRYRAARILLGGSNFGCGSSREHAVWGLKQYGIDAVIASSFADIFYSNAMNNRLLLIQLDRDDVEALSDDVVHSETPIVSIDVIQRKVLSPSGSEFPFQLSPRHLQMVAYGSDTIDLTLGQLSDIEAFEQRHYQENPWAMVNNPS